MVRFGSLFAGIGGFDLGLERAGMTCAWQVEKDPFCTMVLEKHWPDVRRYKDVRECGKHNLETVDLVAGGFPCQPHSRAGKRRGEKDDRNLWPEFARIVSELRPAWVLGENVVGLRATMLDQVLSDLERMEYETWTSVIPAAAVDARHRRERIWIVAHSKRDEHIHEKQESHVEETEIQKEYRQKHGSAGQSGRTVDGRVSSDGYDKDKSMARIWERCRVWPTEPGVDRVVNGVPDQMDRIRALGNAVVPQLVRVFGEAIMEANKHEDY